MSKEMSKEMSFGKFIAIGSTSIIAILAVLHFTWFGPQLDRKKEMIQLFGAAHAVQAAAASNYALVPSANASNIDLERRFPGSESLENLLRLSAKTGVNPGTGFDPDTMGNALALSSFVLTGDDVPQFLDLTKNQAMDVRQDELIASVSFVPW